MPVGLTVSAQGCRLGAQDSCPQARTHNPEPSAGRKWFSGMFLLCIVLFAASSVQASNQDPSVGHGFGKVIGGLLFELPRTVIDATLTAPPVVGTMIGLLAGTARALQTTAAGVVEMAAGFDPWGTKKRQR